MLFNRKNSAKSDSSSLPSNSRKVNRMENFSKANEKSGFKSFRKLSEESNGM